MTTLPPSQSLYLMALSFCQFLCWMLVSGAHVLSSTFRSSSIIRLELYKNTSASIDLLSLINKKIKILSFCQFLCWMLVSGAHVLSSTFRSSSIIRLELYKNTSASRSVIKTLERETRLELATSTLARLRSTN